MLYTKDDVLYYFVEEQIGNSAFDLYIYHTMEKVPNAVKSIIDINIQNFNLKGEYPKASWRYELILDFLGNVETDMISKIKNQFNKYLYSNAIDYKVTTNPLSTEISNMKLEDIINLINDNSFQSHNASIKSLNSSTWKIKRIK